MPDIEEFGPDQSARRWHGRTRAPARIAGTSVSESPGQWAKPPLGRVQIEHIGGHGIPPARRTHTASFSSKGATRTGNRGNRRESGRHDVPARCSCVAERARMRDQWDRRRSRAPNPRRPAAATYTLHGRTFINHRSQGVVVLVLLDPDQAGGPCELGCVPRDHQARYGPAGRVAPL